jgi:hypothetical protein
VAPHGIDTAGLADWADAMIDDLAAGAEISEQRLAPHLTFQSG